MIEKVNPSHPDKIADRIAGAIVDIAYAQEANPRIAVEVLIGHGSDMADSVTGGGLHGKDLSKADVTLNIYTFLKAQETGETVELSCAIGDEVIDGHSYSELMDIARNHIASLGGFEKFAEWGLF